MATPVPDPASSPPGRTRAFRIAAALLITAGLSAAILWWVPIGEVAAALAAMSPAWLGPMALVYAVSYPCRAARFRNLGAAVPIGPMTGVVAVHQFMNRVMPFRTGELAFPVLARRLTGASMLHGVSLVLLTRLLDLGMLALLFLGALLCSEPARERIGPWGFWGVLLLAAATFAGFPAFPWVGGRVARALARRLRARRPAWADRVESEGRMLDDLRGTALRGFLAATGWTALIWLATFALFWMSLRSVGLSLHPADVVLGSSVAVIAAVLPIGGLGSFGTLEAGWAAGFALLGVAAGPALASGLVMSGTSFLFAAVAAALSVRGLRSRSSGRP
jgi:hypothetical protein